MATRYAVILAGGSGTRFWPMSRTLRPKQLLPLVGSAAMIRQTVDRILPGFPPERILVLCGRAHKDRIQRELDMLPPQNVIDEPEGRDTAAAVGLAAAYLDWKDPGSSFCILPADQHIAPAERFLRTLDAGFAAAESGALVTFGIKPTFPATGYGYLERGAAAGAAFRVTRFCEKPDPARAREFVAGGRHFWNSGMFVWRCASILEALQKHLPDHHHELMAIRAALGTSRTPAVLAEAFGRMKRISIDYGVMEKAGNVLMIEADFDWDDVGSWSAAMNHRAKDAQGNAIEALCAAVDTSGSLIVSSDDRHLVGVIGLRDMVVVHTKDATLVCPRDRSEDLKQLIETIRSKGLEGHL